MTVNPSGQGLLSNPPSLARAVNQALGIRVDVVDGAAANTKMNVADLRVTDQLIQAMVLGDTWGVPVSDLANITVQSTTAAGTITISGNPVAGETVTVNGNVYTFRAAPTLLNEVLITAGNVTTMATALKNAINGYETRYESALHGDGNRLASVLATSNAGVVTVTSIVDGNGNAPVVTGTATVLVAAGSGTGAATLTAASVVADNTFVVNGVTFTAKATPTTDIQFALKGTDDLQAAEIARAINAYHFKYGTLGVVASAALAVVTITPQQRPSGNAISLSEDASNVAVSGAYLTGGTATGGIKSSTNLSAATLMLVWQKK